jgi:hypothetical protein
MKRFITNIGFNFWASGNYTLSNNFYFHFKCLDWTIGYLIKTYGRDSVRYLVGYTDGCPDQYKSRLWALMIGLICDLHDLEEYLHYYAHTACFKTNIDSFGSDTKTFVKWQELRELCRLLNAEDVYNECKKMPAPRIVTDSNRELEKNDQRIQVFLIDIKDATDAHRNDPFCIITDSANESWDATAASGIKSIYAIRGFKGSSTTGIPLVCMTVCIYMFKDICIYMYTYIYTSI